MFFIKENRRGKPLSKYAFLRAAGDKAALFFFGGVYVSKIAGF